MTLSIARNWDGVDILWELFVWSSDDDWSVYALLRTVIRDEYHYTFYGDRGCSHCDVPYELSPIEYDFHWERFSYIPIGMLRTYLHDEPRISSHEKIQAFHDLREWETNHDAG